MPDAPLAPPLAPPDHTAVRVALWRALHVLVDAPPHVLDDTLGLRLADPPEGWQGRPDMHPQGTAPMRAWVVARARFLDELVADEASRGVGQYVLLGAGLDTFAQRRADLASRLRVFEVDQPGTVAWKQRRLRECGLPAPDGLTFVPVDFEAGGSWRQQLASSGFDEARPAVVASTGVSMYLTREAIVALLRSAASLAPGSTLAMTFMLPIDQVDPQERVMREFAERGARASGTPFISFFTPAEAVALALEAGFARAEHVASEGLAERYFSGRPDGLRPAFSEQFLLART